MKNDTFISNHLSQVFDASNSVKDIVKIFNVEAKLKNIDINCSNDTDIVINTDVERVNLILLNVVRKAVRLADRGTSIEIDCWTEI